MSVMRKEGGGEGVVCRRREFEGRHSRNQTRHTVITSSTSLSQSPVKFMIWTMTLMLVLLFAIIGN
jgi:hypothetical protein